MPGGKRMLGTRFGSRPSANMYNSFGDSFRFTCSIGFPSGIWRLEGTTNSVFLLGCRLGEESPRSFYSGFFFVSCLCRVCVRARQLREGVTGRRPSSTLAIRLGAFPLASGTSFRLDVFAEEIHGFQYEMFLGC